MTTPEDEMFKDPSTHVTSVLGQEAQAPAVKQKRKEAMQSSAYLQSLATDARAIIDVGINKGTPSLYRAFKHLPFVLVDPARGAEAKLTYKPRQYTFVNKAVGQSPGRMILRENSGKSTLLEPKGEFRTWKPIAEYEVEIERLDTIIAGLAIEGPFGVKIDIEGYELDAIRGMTGIMDQVDFLICEVNVRNRLEGVYQFSDLVSELVRHDLVFFNFLNNFKPNARIYDVAFLRRSSTKFDSAL